MFSTPDDVDERLLDGKRPQVDAVGQVAEPGRPAKDGSARQTDRQDDVGKTSQDHFRARSGWMPRTVT